MTCLAPPLLIFLLLSNSFAIDIQFSVQLDNKTIQIKCNNRELPNFCAASFCQLHSLNSNVEGLNCQQLISDEIVERGGNPGFQSQILPPIITLRVNDRFDDDFISADLRAFCATFQISRMSCTHISADVFSQVHYLNELNYNRFDNDNDNPQSPFFNNNHSKSQYPKKLYLQIFHDNILQLDLALPDLLTGGDEVHVTTDFSHESKSKFKFKSFTFRSHEPSVAVAQHFCSRSGISSSDCLIDDLISHIEKCSQTNINKNKNESYLISGRRSFTLSGLEWAPNPNNILVYEYSSTESVGRSVATFCAVNRCPDRTNYATSLFQYFHQVSLSTPLPPLHSSSPPLPPIIDLISTQTINIHPLSTSDSIQTDHLNPRIVVSMTTMPSRMQFLPQILRAMLNQSVRPSRIYVNVPDFSVREQRSYSIPKEIYSFYHEELSPEERSILTFLPCADFGPATKLIPVLNIETHPATVVITIDDDIDYPKDFIKEFKMACIRYPNAALGLKGYVLPPPQTIDIHHTNFAYYDSLNMTKNDRQVHVLGGFTGVAYRSGFFDVARLCDYSSYPAGSFFVDDDWIAGALEDSMIPRIVLGEMSVPLTSAHLFNENVVLATSNIFSLNGVRTFRNQKFQQELLEKLRNEEDCFLSDLASPSPCFLSTVFDPEYYFELDMRRDSFRLLFDELQKSQYLNQSDLLLLETGTTSATTNWPFSGQSTLLFDRFLNFNHNDGQLFSVDLDPNSCDVSRSQTSKKVSVHTGDSVAHLLSLAERWAAADTFVDVIYLDSWDVTTENWSDMNDNDPSLHAMKELSAIFSRLRRPGGIVLVDDNMIEGVVEADSIREMFKLQNSTNYETDTKIRGKGRMVNDFMNEEEGCRKVFHGWQLAWIC